MSDVLKIGLVQLNAGPSILENLKVTEVYIRQAAAQGAQLILTPENTCHVRSPATQKRESALPEETNPVLKRFRELSAELKVWLVAGSVSIPLPDGMIANRCFVFDDIGNIVARYDKIHLFDVDLPTGEKHRESNLCKAGDEAVVVSTPWAALGLAICYDLRFASQFRAMALAGAEILSVPAAFTVPTGQAHWHTLLRARAIENGAFVVAPAQCGTHEGGRQTYGHSLIIDPWGRIIAEAGEEPCVLMADINLDDVKTARSSIPSLQHDRDFSLKKA